MVLTPTQGLVYNLRKGGHKANVNLCNDENKPIAIRFVAKILLDVATKKIIPPILRYKNKISHNQKKGVTKTNIPTIQITYKKLLYIQDITMRFTTRKCHSFDP